MLLLLLLGADRKYCKDQDAAVSALRCWISISHSTSRTLCNTSLIPPQPYIPRASPPQERRGPLPFPCTVHHDLVVHILRHELDRNLAWHNAAGLVSHLGCQAALCIVV